MAVDSQQRDGFPVSENVPVDIYAKSPNQRALVIHLGSGAADVTRVVDGRNAWNTSAGTLMPIPVVPLSTPTMNGVYVPAICA